MEKNNNESNEFWAERCRLNDAYKFVDPEEIPRFRDKYAEILRSYKNPDGSRIFSEERVLFEAYEYLDDEEIASCILHGETPEDMADIMSRWG